MIATTAATAQTLSGPARVIDGDTIAIAGLDHHVRLNFIDAPERAQVCQNAKGSSYSCGILATETLKRIIPEGTEVVCVSDGRDGYERYLATCKVGETDVNGSMVWSGWALEYDRYSDGRYNTYEAQARSAGRGLWQGVFVEPWRWREEKRQAQVDVERSNATAASECRIKGNISRQGRIYHMPGQMDYDRVRIDEERGERMFCSEQEAQDAGWHRAMK